MLPLSRVFIKGSDRGYFGRTLAGRPDGTDKARARTPGPYSSETAKPPAPPIKPSAPSPRSALGPSALGPSAPGPSAPGLPSTAPAPASVGGSSSRLSDFNYLNSTGE